MLAISDTSSRPPATSNGLAFDERAVAFVQLAVVQHDYVDTLDLDFGAGRRGTPVDVLRE
jgi:hypothetical protein